MLDPILQQELMESKEEEGKDLIEIPEELTKDKVIELIKEANDYAIEKFKQQSFYILQQGPMFIPVAISCYSHDYITEKYQFTESVFKHAMFKHKVFDDQQLMAYMT